MGIQWIEHKGKSVLHIDYRGLKMEKDMIALGNQVPSFIQDKPLDEKLLMLIDLSSCYTTAGFIDASKKIEKEFIERYSVKRAILGITGPKVVLLKGFNLFTRQKLEPFNHQDEALNYLIK